MTTFQTTNFDDFLSNLPAGAALDALAAKFGLTRTGGETDNALLARIETAAGYTGTLSPVRYFPP
jgi:hypothetical protein